MQKKTAAPLSRIESNAPLLAAASSAACYDQFETLKGSEKAKKGKER